MDFIEHLRVQIKTLKENGFYKEEKAITSPQKAEIEISDGKKVLNLCANNYLGLANDPRLIKVAKESYDQFGFGMASVRFICGTQTIHQALERKIASFLKTEDSILYTSCFDANGGLFETLFTEEDGIISDSLNHASIIDGIRLSKSKKWRYQNNDMEALEEKLKEASSCRFKIIATDGVFSMDGIIANLPAICRLADKYNALVMVDDSHAVGFVGQGGRGTPEHCGVMDRVDILTGTFGKALGGASGGYTAGRREIIDYLRQRSRPYLFSNSLAPSIAMASLTVIDLIEQEGALREKLKENTRYFRQKMEALQFTLVPGEHPIIPVMLGSAVLAQSFARQMLKKGVYVVGFSYPVVPEGKARIRTQMSSAHSKENLDFAIECFKEVGTKLGVIP